MKTIFALLVAVTWIHQVSAGTGIIPVPGGGIQPQAAPGKDGTLHLIYFKGPPAAGNLFYARRPPDGDSFTAPIRVNTTDDAAIAMGTIRGAHLALGKEDRVHVAWMGSGNTATRPAEEGRHPQSPMLYTRMNEAGDAFEPERNVMQWTGGLDGGGSIAADSIGHVFVAWHGSAPDNADGEQGRAMFVAVSGDDGNTFARERQANPEPIGSCSCCGMRAFIDRKDQLHLLYRGANKISRDMTLLTSTDQGRTFTSRTVNVWRTQTCPMSSAAMIDHRDGLMMATEVDGLLELSWAGNNDRPVATLGKISSTPGKHAAMAFNRKGELLVAWAEGAGWARGGQLTWRLFDRNGHPVDREHTLDAVPEWSFPAVVSLDEGFLLLR